MKNRDNGRVHTRKCKQGDTVGGTVTCVIQNVPVGLGEPVFDKLT
jgi:chorismate synthase